MTGHRMHQTLIPALSAVCGALELVWTSCECGWAADPAYDPETGAADYQAHLADGKCHACGQPLPKGDQS